jgi:hypothetical protein
MTFEKGAVFVACSVAACCVAATLFVAGRLVAGDHSEITGAEPFVVFSIEKLLLGDPLYSDPAKPPFDVTQYSPLYYYVCALASHWAGFSAEDAVLNTRAARLASCASWAATCGMVYLMQRSLFAVGRLAALIVCAYLTVYCAPWWLLARPDSMQTAFLTASLGCAIAGFQRRERIAKPSDGGAWFILSGLFGVAAAFSKQNGAQAVLLFALFCVVSGQWRPLLQGGAAAFGIGSALLGLSVYWYGPAFYAHVVNGLRNGIDLDRAIVFTYMPLFSTSAIILAAAAWVVREWSTSHQPVSRRFLVFCVVGLFAFATATGLKYGSADNYYIDFLLFALTALSAYWTKASEEVKASMRFVVAAYLIFFLPIRTIDNFKYLRGGPHYADAKPAAEFLATELAADPDACLYSADLRLNCLLPSRALTPQMLLSKLAFDRGLVKYDRLGRMFETGNAAYSALVVRGNDAPPEYVLSPLGAPRTRFRLLRRFGEVAVYRNAGGAAPSVQESVANPR